MDKIFLQLVEEFPKTRDALMITLYMCLVSLVMPLKIVAFTVHNLLTKRDYSYSIDDICDIGLLVCDIVWFYTYMAWSSLPKDEGTETFVQT